MSSKGNRKISAYHPGFERHLIKNGVYPIGYQHLDDRSMVKPENWNEIQQRLLQPRPSLSRSQFSDGAFQDFSHRVDQVTDGPGVTARAFPILEGDSDMPSGRKKPFGNLVALTDGTIVNAQPDIYYGARPDQPNESVHKGLNSYIIPTTDDKAPILPNNFAELMGPDGTWAVAKRQACYDGAIGARAMQHLQSYEQPEPVYENNANTIISAFDGDFLQMYTTHPTEPTNPGGKPEYHMNRLRSWAMTGNPETFRQGATAYRNARDWAKERRDEFIEAANGRATSLPQDSAKRHQRGLEEMK
jgi:hypothetical protein